MKHDYLVLSLIKGTKYTRAHPLIEATGNDQPITSSQRLCNRLENDISFTKSENENGLEMSDKAWTLCYAEGLKKDVIFHPEQIPIKVILLINNQSLADETSIRYLGVYRDSNISWKSQIN